MGLFSDTKVSHPRYAVGMPTDQDEWTCSNWIAYHKNLQTYFTKAYSNLIIQQDAERCGWFASVHNCKYDCGFVNYFKAQGISDIGNIFSKLWCATDAAVDNFGNAVDNVSQTVTNLSKTARLVSKPGVLIAGGLLVGFYFLDKYERKKR